MQKTLLACCTIVFLTSCTTQDSARIDGLLGVANSSSGKNLIRIVSSQDHNAATQALLDRKRTEWERDPMQLVYDLREAKRDYDQLMDALSGKVTKQWGKKETRLPGRKTYVKYNQRYQSRAIVDFERGTIQIETLEQNASTSLKSAIIATLLTPEDPASVDVFSDKAVDLNSNRPPFLLGLVLDDSGREIRTQAAAARFADQRLQQTGSRLVQTDSGPKTLRYVDFRMVANFEDQKAQKYLQTVRKYAKQYNISPSLILSVMRSESSFNPHAVSSAPAYGLMQLVPTSGGREAYRRARNQDKIPSPDYLFNPDNNIELGTAYLNVLTYQQLDDIADRTSRDYCVISAYNTGPSNVMRAFTSAPSSQRFSAGLQKINSLSPPQVYQQLRSKLPYAETRNYLSTVNTNRKRYYSVDQTVGG